MSEINNKAKHLLRDTENKIASTDKKILSELFDTRLPWAKSTRRKKMINFKEDTKNFAKERIKQYIESDERTEQEKKNINAIMNPKIYPKGLDSMDSLALSQFYNLICRSLPR